MKTKVSVRKAQHRGQIWLRLSFPYNALAGQSISESQLARWSETLRSWLLPFRSESIEFIMGIFTEIEYLDEESRSLALGKGIDIRNEVLVWSREDYIYLKTDAYNSKDKSFLARLEWARNYNGTGYWKIRGDRNNMEELEQYFGNRLRKWPSLMQEVLNEERRFQNRNKVTAVIAGSQVRVVFEWNKQLIDFIKSMPFHHWDSDNRWWVFAYNEKTLKSLEEFCKQNKFDLKVDNIPVLRTVAKRAIKFHDPAYRRCPANMVEKLVNKRYSDKTIKIYCSMFEEFINYHRKFVLEEIGNAEIKEFIAYLVQERRVSTSYQNQAVNAIKFYYEKVLGGPRKFIDLDRPRREKKLPEVLSREEVKAMISAMTNPKHKFILILLYSTGLRRNELLQLKLEDIDRDNMQIWVRNGKGKKDRYVQLGNGVLKFMDEYIALFNPQEYLIEGIHDQYSASSLAQIINSAAKKAGVAKKVTPHKFRHSYATHLLEDGVDTRFIQELLGHASIKTTQIYSHVTSKNIKNITNPFDKMDI